MQECLIKPRTESALAEPVYVLELCINITFTYLLLFNPTLVFFSRKTSLSTIHFKKLKKLLLSFLLLTLNVL